DEAMRVGIPKYEKRYKAMAAAIDESFPAGERTDPTGGFFIWWQSENKDFDSGAFLEQTAIPNDLLYVPGKPFYPITGYAINDGGNDLISSKPELNTMRLGFSYASPEVISEGMSKLGNLLSKEL
ncbi:MAG: hypothetical protein RTU09_09845, partial [Candidatus Thorarchaeota archaeon]